MILAQGELFFLQSCRTFENGGSSELSAYAARTTAILEKARTCASGPSAFSDNLIECVVC